MSSCTCEKIQTADGAYMHYSSCPAANEGDDAGKLKELLKGLMIGAPADLVHETLGKSIKRKTLGTDPQYENHPEFKGSVIVQWDYPRLSFIIARGIVNTQWGRMSAYCVQKIIMSKKEAKSWSTKPYRSKRGKRK